MTTPPANPLTQSTANRAPAITLRVGPDDGSTPAAADETLDFQLLEVSRFAGRQRLDQARLQVDLGRSGQRLVDLETPARWSRQVEARLADDEDPDVSRDILFWGELSTQQIQIGAAEEAFVDALIERYHFGDPPTSYRVYDPAIGGIVSNENDPVFNPLIDGVIEGNRSSRSDDDDDLWVDPESLRTPQASGYHGTGTGTGVTGELWTLPQAVRAMIKLCNPLQEFIRNPEIDPDADFWNDAPDVKNLRMPRGRYLPEYLDLLLHRHGYDWYVDVTLDDGDAAAREIVIFKIGDGEEKEVFFQAPGETLDLAQQNVQEVGLETSIAELANVVRGLGSLKQFEVTVPLYRAWDDAGDAFTARQLRKQDALTGAVNDTYVDNPTAWRLYVAGEAGDLVGLRGDSPSAPPDFASELEVTAIPVRRPLSPTLTLDARGKRQRPVLEWSDDAGVSWKRWDESDKRQGTYKVLADQIGVMFDRIEVPEALIAAGADGRLRITGTITVDERLADSVDRSETSPNIRNVELVLDLSDRFHCREIDLSSEFASELQDPDADTAEADDADALTEYLEQLQDATESAAMQGSFTLYGIHLDYAIGDLITKIAGRDIALNRNSPTAAAKKYLQVVGLRWDLQRQQTILSVVPAEKR